MSTPPRSLPHVAASTAASIAASTDQLSLGARISPRFGPADTTVEIERRQAKILAGRTPSERLRLAFELSAEVITRSQAAVRRSMPGASEDEVMTRWVRLNHGDAIAALFANGVSQVEHDARRIEREPMTQADFISTMGAIADALSRIGADHCVGGSVASSHHGLARSTLDVDFVARLTADQARSLVGSLQPRFYGDEDTAIDAVRRGTSFNLIDQTTGVKVDIFVAGTDVLAHSSIKHASPDRSTGVRMASAEDVVVAKLRWFRLTGESSDRQWRDVLGILRTAAGQFDLERTTRLAELVGVGDLLERVIVEA